MTGHKYKRVLLKLSGESLQGNAQFGYNGDAVEEIVNEIAKLHQAGTEIAIVVGGGNIMRGKSISGHGVGQGLAQGRVSQWFSSKRSSL